MTKTREGRERQYLHRNIAAGRCQNGIGIPPISRAEFMRDLPEFMANVYEKRPLGNQSGSPFQFNIGGTGFFTQFYLWMLVRALQPKHIIESGAYNGLGTWTLRQAAPNAQIIVVSPATPHLYIDNHADSLYFTDVHFRDFAAIDWSCVKRIDRSQTLIFFDDHQSGYRRMLEAHARGFRHLLFDDNSMPERSDSDHFSAKGACAAFNGSLHVPSPGTLKWDDFRGIVADWGRFKKGVFNVSEEQLQKVAHSFGKVIDVYAEMPPLWTGGRHRPDAPYALLDQDAAKVFVEQHAHNLRSAWTENRGYANFGYVHTKSLNDAPANELYYPGHVAANGYQGILPVETGRCDRRSSGGASPAKLKPTRERDDPRRNSGAGVKSDLRPSN